jgi:hypothetical protein
MTVPGRVACVVPLVLTAVLASAPAIALERGARWVSRPAVEPHFADHVVSRAQSPDLGRIILDTEVDMTADDEHYAGDEDLFAWDDGHLTLLSPGPREYDPSVDNSAAFDAASRDVRRVAWSTGADLDDDQAREHYSVETGRDVYVTYKGKVRLVSTGPRAGRGEFNQGESREFSADYAGASKDLRRIFFSTEEQLLAADHDDRQDLYMREGSKTTLVSSSRPRAIVALVGVSDDGHRAFLGSEERLTRTDTDGSYDDFVWHDGKLRQVSIGPHGGNGPHDARGTTGAGLLANSPDGRRAWFHTGERLTADDHDDYFDLYENHDGRTTRVSTGPRGGNGPFDSGLSDNTDHWDTTGDFARIAAGGRRVYFRSWERLTPDDHDRSSDIYVREGGRTTLLAGGRGGETKGFGGVGLVGISVDDRRVFVSSPERLTADDRDRSIDIFEVAGGHIRRLTKGPRGGNHDQPFGYEAGYRVRPTDAFYAGLSPDGTRLFFASGERLTADDRDKRRDIYETAGGRTTRVRIRTSSGRTVVERSSPVAISTHGERFLHYGPQEFVAADHDREGWGDLYLMSIR